MDANAKATITLMGSSPSGGTPSFFCGCVACEEAKTDPRARRTCSSLLISANERTLIDCAPEAQLQFEREGIDDVERILFTHQHYDHVGGIPWLEYLVRLKRRRPIDFYCSKEAAEFISSHFDFMDDTFVIHELEAWQTVEFDGISYTPLPAQHCSGCFGYLIKIPARLNDLGHDAEIAYFPDTSRPSDEVLERLKGIDMLIIDATFNGANWMPDSHLNIDDACAIIEEVGAKRGCLTHMSMHYDEPITLAQAEARFAGTNIVVSYDGLKVFG